jgi:hypothetical protein
MSMVDTQAIENVLTVLFLRLLNFAILDDFAPLFSLV